MDYESNIATINCAVESFAKQIAVDMMAILDRHKFLVIDVRLVSAVASISKTTRLEPVLCLDNVKRRETELWFHKMVRTDASIEKYYGIHDNGLRNNPEKLEAARQVKELYDNINEAVSGLNIDMEYIEIIRIAFQWIMLNREEYKSERK